MIYILYNGAIPRIRLVNGNGNGNGASWTVLKAWISRWFISSSIKILTEGLKWCLMLQQRLGRTLCQTLHVHVGQDIQMIMSSDWPKWHCALLCNFPTFYRTKCQFRWSDKQVVNTFIDMHNIFTKHIYRM